MPHYINYNGKFLETDAPIVSSGNRGLRYGDGLFESMKFVNGEIQLDSFHFERLFHGLHLLQFRVPEHLTQEYLRDMVIELCSKNNLHASARIRLNVFRKNGGVYDRVDQTPDFVIETWALPDENLHLNQSGLIIDVYKEARKSCDSFSNIKSNNYLPYTMGALYAKQNNLNDCLILNTHDRICESTISNVFWIKESTIFTPPLSEGCVSGVMRRHLFRLLREHGYSINEKQLSISELHQADELFLSNAISGIRWVREFQNKQYTNQFTATIYLLLG